MRRWSVLLKLTGSLVGLVLSAVTSAPAQGNGIPTLRVYTNVVQVPTLVLSGGLKPLPPIPASRFFVSIDDGTRFRVTHARVEGNDPLALGILVDANHLPEATEARLQESIAGLAQNSVHGNDKVSVYSMSCKLTRGIAEQPTNAENLRKVAAALFGEGKKHEKEKCEHPWKLLDAIAAAVEGFDQNSGRRVLLVLTSGEDLGSKLSWDQVRRLAQIKGVAIFAIKPQQDFVVPPAGRGGIGLSDTAVAATNMPSLCESTGGLLLDSSRDSAAEKLRQAVTLVRGRYIIEFPSPAAAAGQHKMTITVEKMRAFIRPAGISILPLDPSLAKDPNTFLPDPANAPEVGKRPPKQ